MEQKSDDLAICPSFSDYSMDGLATVAARVVDEVIEEAQGVEATEDFEFSLVFSEEGEFSTDALVYEGQFGPIFPIFNRDLLANEDRDGEIKPNTDASSIGLTLKKLFLDDREEVQSSSSSEADELETLPEGTYCVWRPKVVESSPSTCKKSNSTGSGSKRWNLRSFLRRSNSDGKEPFVFLTPKQRDEKAAKTERGEKAELPKLPGKLRTEQAVVSLARRNSNPGEAAKATGKLTAIGDRSSSSTTTKTSAHEVFYVRNRAEKEGGKRKSYLPYRRDLLGFFANVNGTGMLPFK